MGKNATTYSFGGDGDGNLTIVVKEHNKKRKASKSPRGDVHNQDVAVMKADKRVEKGEKGGEKGMGKSSSSARSVLPIEWHDSGENGTSGVAHEVAPPHAVVVQPTKVVVQPTKVVDQSKGRGQASKGANKERNNKATNPGLDGSILGGIETELIEDQSSDLIGKQLGDSDQSMTRGQPSKGARKGINNKETNPGLKDVSDTILGVIEADLIEDQSRDLIGNQLVDSNANKSVNLNFELGVKATKPSTTHKKQKRSEGARVQPQLGFS